MAFSKVVGPGPKELLLVEMPSSLYLSTYNI